MCLCWRLCPQSKAFEKTTRKVKKQSKMDNMKAKWKLIAVVVGLAVIIIVVVIIMGVIKSPTDVPHEKVGNPITPAPGGT